MIDKQLSDKLASVARIRNRMVHDYVGLAALDVHEGARLIHAALPRFVTAYQQWLRDGFHDEVASGAARPLAQMAARREDRRD